MWSKALREELCERALRQDRHVSVIPSNCPIRLSNVLGLLAFGLEGVGLAGQSLDDTLAIT